MAKPRVRIRTKPRRDSRMEMAPGGIMAFMYTPGKAARESGLKPMNYEINGEGCLVPPAVAKYALAAYPTVMERVPPTPRKNK